MATFPVISSILSPRHIASHVVAYYNLESASARLLRAGVNHTYLIETGEERYVYRVYTRNWRSKEEIEAEIQLLAALKEQGIKVSYALPDKEGGWMQEIEAAEGMRYGLLFSYCGGKLIREHTGASARKLGETMAHMHQVMQNRTLPRKTYDATSLLTWAAAQLAAHFHPEQEEVQYVQRAAKKLAEVMAEAPASQLRTGLVHLDMGYGNIKEQEDGSIAVYDFDNLGNGWLFLDIAYSVMIMFRHQPHREKYEVLLAAFLAGYETVLPVSETEKSLIPWGGMAIWLHYAGVHAYRFDDFTSVFFDEAFLKFWVTFIHGWLEYHGIEI